MKKKRMNIYSVKDQMERYNISEEEALEKIKNIKNVNVFSVDWQMKRFNLTEEEAKNKIESIKNKHKETQSKMTEFEFNSMIPSKKEHWLKKGLSDEESEKMVSKNIEIGTKNCNGFIKKVKEDPDSYKDVMTTQIGFYIKKGYSEEESRKMLSEKQSTFSFVKCVEKYGEEEGHRIWKERQEKWYEKTKDKLSKGYYLKYDSILKEFGGDEEMADKVFVERVHNISKSSFGKSSKNSMKIFNQLIYICDKNDLSFRCGIDGNSEYLLFSKKTKRIYLYDFTIVNLNLIFEFQGEKFHSKVENAGINDLGIDLNYKYSNDKLKKELAEKQGFEVIYLWEEDGFEHNIKKSVSILLDRIN